MRQVKTQSSLGIRPVWSVFAVRLKKPTHREQSEDWSDWADAQANQSSLSAQVILLVLSCGGALLFQELLTPTKKKNSLVPLTARTKLLVLCNQSEPITFTEAIPQKYVVWIELMKYTIVKILYPPSFWHLLLEKVEVTDLEVHVFKAL